MFAPKGPSIYDFYIIFGTETLSLVRIGFNPNSGINLTTYSVWGTTLSADVING